MVCANNASTTINQNSDPDLGSVKLCGFLGISNGVLQQQLAPLILLPPFNISIAGDGSLDTEYKLIERTTLPHPTEKHCLFPRKLYAKRNIVNILSTDFINFGNPRNENLECKWTIKTEHNQLGWIRVLVVFDIDDEQSGVKCGKKGKGKWIYPRNKNKYCCGNAENGIFVRKSMCSQLKISISNKGEQGLKKLNNRQNMDISPNFISTGGESGYKSTCILMNTIF